MNKTFAFTARKLYPVLAIHEEGDSVVNVILKKDGTFMVQSAPTNTVSNGPYPWPHDKEAEFMSAYESFKENLILKERDLAQAKADAERREAERVADLEASIRKDVISADGDAEWFADFRHITHHRCKKADGPVLRMDSTGDVEDILTAIRLGLMKGMWGELSIRDGHHDYDFAWFGFSSSCDDPVAEYAKRTEAWFGKTFFYRDKDTEMECLIENIHRQVELDAIRKLIADYDDMEAGYYGNSGELLIEASEFNRADFLGYRYDVISYSLAFEVEQLGENQEQ